METVYCRLQYPRLTIANGCSLQYVNTFVCSPHSIVRLSPNTTANMYAARLVLPIARTVAVSILNLGGCPGGCEGSEGKLDSAKVP